MVHFFNRRVLQYNFHRLYDFLKYIFGGLKIFTRTGFSCLVIFLVWYISQCGSHASIRSRNKQMMSQSSVKNTTEVNVLFIFFLYLHSTKLNIHCTSSDMASEISTYLCSIYETLLMWRIITTILVLPFH